MRKYFAFFTGLLLSVMLIPEIGCTQDAHNIRLMGRWPYGYVRAVVIKGNYVYLGAGGVVCVLDVTNPSSPVKAGELNTPGVVQKLFISDNTSMLLMEKPGCGRLIFPIPPTLVRWAIATHRTGQWVFMFAVHWLMLRTGLAGCG